MQVFKKESELTPCEFQEGFYVAPNYNRFSVTRDGRVFDRIRQHFPSIYPSRHLSTGKIYLKTTGNIPVHILVADTFLDDSHIPINERPEVNHIDGNTENNRDINLEWCIHRENITHAYETGLMSTNIPLLCKNLLTHEIKRFYSYRDCARFFNVHLDRIRYFLNSKRKDKTFMTYFSLIKEGEEWSDINKDCIDKHSKSCSKPTVVINKELRQLHIFKSITEASKYVNIDRAVLAGQLTHMSIKNRKFVDLGNYKITYISHIHSIREKGMEEIIHVGEKMY